MLSPVTENMIFVHFYKLSNHCRRIILPIFFFLINIQVEARVYNSLRFTTSEGLAGDNVYSIAQDKDGFIWIATETGVSRFDGHSFKNYTVRDGLPSNDVNWFYVDSKNRVWMSPFKKEICYFYKGRIHNKHRDDWMKKIIVGSEEKAMAEDNAGNLLICTNNGTTFIAANDSCQIYPSFYNGNGFFKPKYHVGHVPIAFVDTALGKYKTTYNGIVTEYTSPLINDSTRVTIQVSGKERYLIIFRKGKAEVITKPANVYGWAFYSTSSIILNTQDGCYLYNVCTQKITDTLLTGMLVNTSYADKDSGIWVGTNGNGLFYFPPNRGVLIRQSDSNKQVNAFHFYSYKNDLWVGTNNFKLWKLDQQRYTLKHVKRIDERILYPPKGNLVKKTELSIHRSIIMQKGEADYIHISPKSIMNVQDTFIGAAATEIIRYITPVKKLDSISFDDRITCAYYHNGIYYIGTLNGLYISDKPVMFFSFKHRKPLIKGVINSIAHSYKNGLFWVTTSENGAYCFSDSSRVIIKHINDKNGLSSPVCNTIFTDGAKVYIGTNNGLNIIDPAKSFLVEQYYTLDGLPSNFINCVFASGNKVWVGTTEGLCCIDLSVKHRNSFFKLSLTQVLVSGKEITADTNDILLMPEDNNIRFEYSGVTFASMGIVQYHYRLKGLNDVWQTTDQPYLQYPSLPSGDYTFELYAIDRFNTRSNLVSFTFTIAKEWWEYRWVQAMGLLLLLGAAGSVLWLRITRVQKREQEKIELRKKIIELEQLALRAQMNPHFIFNSLNSFYQYVIDKDLEGASKFMSDFSHLIRLLFETTSQYEITLDKEIDFLSTYLALERTKFSNTFSYDITVQADIFTEEIVMPSFIIQPFIENSIWHGIQNRKDNLGIITVSVVADIDLLTITVDDNGVGRVYTDTLRKRTMDIHKSRGIALTRERIELYNNTHRSTVRFEIIDKYENGVSTGTRVILKFPLKNTV